MGTLRKDLCTFMIISLWILLGTRNFSDKSCRENEIQFLIYIFFKKSCLLWDNVQKCGTAGQATDDNKIRRCQDANCLPITKARIQRRSNNIQYLLLHNWLIPSDTVRCFMVTQKKLENTQRLICHYSPLNQIVRLKKATSKQTNILLCKCNIMCNVLLPGRSLSRGTWPALRE
jgi:hypothetical protein